MFLARPLHFMFIKMQWTDLLIIYLSCGAPFGVYFFLQNRKNGVSAGLLLKSAAVGLFWIAYAYLLWRKKFAKSITPKTFFKPDPEIALLEQQTSVLQEQILQALIELNSKTKLDLHFFTFRDVLERYAGLTLALKADEKAVGESDFEIFRIAGRKKKELPLAGKCLARKNSMRLKTHQSNAREDFLQQLANLSRAGVLINRNGPGPHISLIKDLILELLELTDVKLIHRAEEIFANAETVPGAVTNYKVNGFYKPDSKIEVIPCQPQQAQQMPPAQSQTQQLRSTPLQMRRSAD